MGNQLVNAETLLTLNIEVEKILNDRALIHLTNDPNDMDSLSPSILLLLRSNPSTSHKNNCNPIYMDMFGRQ